MLAYGPWRQYFHVIHNVITTLGLPMSLCATLHTMRAYGGMRSAVPDQTQWPPDGAASYLPYLASRQFAGSGKFVLPCIVNSRLQADIHRAKIRHKTPMDEARHP